MFRGRSPWLRICAADRAQIFVGGMALMGRSRAKRRSRRRAREGELLAKAIAYAAGCQGQGRWFDADETLYQRVLKARPRHFDALHLLGVLRQQQGRSAEALGLIASALEVSPDQANAWSNRGVTLKSLERWTKRSRATTGRSRSIRTTSMPSSTAATRF